MIVIKVPMIDKEYALSGENLKIPSAVTSAPWASNVGDIASNMVINSCFIQLETGYV